MTNDILKTISKQSDEHEFYTPVPRDYKAGKTKYIIITGSVMSGVGKGIFTSSLGNLLKCHGFNIAPIKFDGYLNYDAGTLNPYRHGEVFVLDDGTECDLDLGTYERFLNQDLSKDNYLTAGKIFKNIIDKERAGKYLGRDVQFIPHVTGEIKIFLRNLALKSKADIILVEVGGTAGDIENSYFLEAMRELRYEEGRENVCFINVTYILEPKSLGEQKSKAAQLGLRTLMSLGIQPDVVACRSENPVRHKIMEKISVYANVPMDKVISLKNVETIYDIPLYLKEINMDKAIFDILKIKPKHNGDKELNFKNWKRLAENIHNPKKEITIGITGKYTAVHDSYLSILKALEHVSSLLEVKIKIKWIETTAIEKGKRKVKEELENINGIIVPGGFGKRGTEGKIECIKYAREYNLPYLGLCFGFQMALIEFARNVLGLKEANSTEIEPNTNEPVVDILPEQKKIEGLGGNMRLGGKDVEIKKGTKAYEIYKGKTIVRERFRHRYECNPEYIKQFEDKGIVFSGKAPKQPIMQILELPNHKFFLGTQYHGELVSKPLKPHPLYTAFVKACINK
jgi:CTP synthase